MMRTLPAQDRAPDSVAVSAREALTDWVQAVTALTCPASVVWFRGEEGEVESLTELLVEEGKLIRLNPTLRPNSFLARTDPGDVARVEERTFICSADSADAGPTNNWRDPGEMKAELADVFAGSMRGRTMYVIPFSMGVPGGTISQLGVEVTDSAYVAVNMAIMTRAGSTALELIDAGVPWVPTVHSVGYPLIDDDNQTRQDVPWPCNKTKYIVQFPDDRSIWSYGSGYGGNALLGKKSFALRIASVMGRDDGWLAEHMLLIKVLSPDGKAYHLAAAFPSACGKTNLSMLQPTIPGWKVETIGDDIAWMRRGPDGRLRAINPEAGFFGVAPGTGIKTNPAAVETFRKNTIFTNVALTHDNDVWWEGLTAIAPSSLVDWEGREWSPASGTPAAHPNSRFTVAASQCPTIADEWEDPAGVPIDAILFGGRRATNLPLVAQSRDWKHGVFMGATISSEQTAAAEGTIGELRRDPFAMLPFCGYNMADYWHHWLDIGTQLGSDAPKIFQVNWFRKDSSGDFIWPGFGENSRVIEWIIRRLEGKLDARDSPAGRLPKIEDLSIADLDLSRKQIDMLFHIDPDSWLIECDMTEQFFSMFGDRTPLELKQELASLRVRLNAFDREKNTVPAAK